MNIQSKIKLIDRKKIIDSRGWFLKVITGLEDNIPQYTGEIYFTNAKPNEAKGGHYHNKANEWFTVITGSCTVMLVDLETSQRHSLVLSSDKPQTLFVPKSIAHIFVNNSNEEFILMAYSDQLFDPADTVMYSDFN